MDMLTNILGGQDRQQADDFVGRYDQGAPWDGIDDTEALDQYKRVAPNLSDDDYQESARQAFSRLDPQQRQELGQYVAQQARQRNIQVDDGDFSDPGFLGQLTGRANREQPGFLENVLGGGGGTGGGMLSSPIGKAAMAGIAAFAMKKFMGGR
jgi:hypothetical protein